MKKLYVLNHLHFVDEYHGEKFMIGVYSSLALAHKAVKRVKDKPGFRDFPEIRDPATDNTSGFYVVEYELDKDYWDNGFIVIPGDSSDQQKRMASSSFIDSR